MFNSPEINSRVKLKAIRDTCMCTILKEIKFLCYSNSFSIKYGNMSFYFGFAAQTFKRFAAVGRGF